MTTKEMYDEIAALLGLVAKAFELSDGDTAKELEDGRIALNMAIDQDGQRFVRVVRQGKVVRIYDGRIFYETEAPADEGCGGGCSCGH